MAGDRESKPRGIPRADQDREAEFAKWVGYLHDAIKVICPAGEVEEDDVEHIVRLARTYQRMDKGEQPGLSQMSEEE